MAAAPKEPVKKGIRLYFEDKNFTISLDGPENPAFEDLASLSRAHLPGLKDYPERDYQFFELGDDG